MMHEMTCSIFDDGDCEFTSRPGSFSQCSLAHAKPVISIRSSTGRYVDDSMLEEILKGKKLSQRGAVRL